jgi:hypothetical protein
MNIAVGATRHNTDPTITPASGATIGPTIVLGYLARHAAGTTRA